MRTSHKLKLALAAILIAALIVPKLPVSLPEDVSRDDRVDLRDAVLLVREFQKSAGDAVAFKKQIGRMLSALRIVSGINIVIQTEPKSGLIHNPSNEISFLISNESSVVGEDYYFFRHDDGMNHYSFNVEPEVPPPENVFSKVPISCYIVSC